MELPDFKNLQKMITFCRKNRINHVKFGEFEFSIDPASFDIQSDYKKKKTTEEIQQDVPTDNPLSEMDILFWSSAGIPDTTQDEALNG